MRGRLAILTLVVVSGVVSALCLLEASQLPGQQPSQAPTFTTTTTYIQVDAHVVDGRGRFVRGLQKSDFRVLEDGQVQTLAYLELVDSSAPVESRPSPLSQKAPEEAAPVGSPPPRAAGTVYYLVVDDLHVRAERTTTVRQLAGDFLRRVPGTGDLVGMVLTSGIGGVIHPSLDRQPLLDRIPRIMGKKMRSAAMASAVELDAQNRARTDQARAALRALADAVTDAAATAGGRKTLVLISEGIDPNKGSNQKLPGAQNDPYSWTVDAETDDELKSVVAVANRANVSVYALDPRGVAGRLGDNIEAPDRRDRGVTADVLLAEERRSQEILEDLAAATDGLSFTRTSNFAGAFDRIKGDSGTYYLLSYKRPETTRKGYHRIEVKVDRPGVTVRARKGYDDKLPLSLPASAAPAPASQAGPPTREPTPPAAAPENRPLVFSGRGQFPSQPPTCFVLLDAESFDGDEARKACAVAGAFVDSLDPDDRVAILSVAGGMGPVEESRDNDSDYRRLLDRANRDTVSFYPIDPRGLAVFDTPIDAVSPTGAGLAGAIDEMTRLQGHLEALRNLASATPRTIMLAFRIVP